MDPFAVVYENEAHTGRLIPVGITVRSLRYFKDYHSPCLFLTVSVCVSEQNIAKDTTDPEWTTSFILNYHFETAQEVPFNLSPCWPVLCP